MRAFVSTVDTPVGRNVSRVLALTVPGSRRPSGQSTGNVEDDESLDQDASESRASEPPKVPYVVFGTLQKFLDEDGAVVTGKGVSDAGGELREEKEKKAEGEEGTSGSLEKRRKDSERKEAVDKFAVLGRKPRWVEDVVQSSDREQLKEALFAADIIVYDLMTSLDEAVWACDCLSVNTEEYEDKPKTFVAISTIMAWARTKLDQDDPDAPLMEDEYRRRKPHPNFKNHVLAEKNIIKCGKKGPLRTYVIGAGLLYHAGDSIFHHFFKAAWHGEPHLTCFGDGTNILPTIHLDDLTNIVVTVADSALEPRYILAVDDSKNSLGEITKAIAESLGTAKVVNVPKEEALLQKDLSQLDHDMLLVNLRLEAGHVKELGIEWTYESGIIENLPALIHEYKNARGLTPLKIVMHGPPASGKTYFSKKLAEHYQIHLVVVEEVIKDAMARLERRASGNLLDSEEDDDVDADRELFAELTEAAKANNGRYPDENVIDFVRNKLKTMPCRNQGYILDGYPALAEEAVSLFKASGEDDDNPEEKATPLLDDVISPEFVFSLECSDEFIKERVMSLPESEVAGTRNSEEALTRRLEEFRTINTEENTVLNVFDESEIFPFAINVEGNETRGNEVLEILKKRIGKPHNYGPTPEQIAIQENIAKSGRIRENQLAEEERSAREHKERLEKEQAVAIWNARMEEVRKQEQDVLEAQSVPLRNYLMRNVMPTLTAALIELCKTRPEDPIDYLAEFLFKHNPTND